MTTSTSYKPNLILEGPSEDLTTAKHIRGALNRLGNYSATNLTSNNAISIFPVSHTPTTTSILTSQTPNGILPGQALLDRVDTALKRSRSINPGIRIKERQDTPNYSILNTPNHIRSGSSTASTFSIDYFGPARGISELLMSVKSDRNQSDIWTENKTEKIKAIKQEGETIQKIYEKLFREDRSRRSPVEADRNIRPVNLSSQQIRQEISTPTATETLNKSAMPLRESRSLTRDYSFKEINDLKSGINSIEGQLNALDSLNNSSHLSRASSVGFMPTAPRSQSCVSRKTSVFEKEDDYNLTVTKKDRVSFFENNMKESMLCRTIPSSSYASKEPSILLDHTVKNIDSVISKPIYEPSTATASKSSLHTYIGQSTTPSRATYNGNAPVRAIYDSSFIPSRDEHAYAPRTPSIFHETPSSHVSFEKELRLSSPAISHAEESSRSRRNVIRPSRRESADKPFCLEDLGCQTPQGEHPLYTTKLTTFLNLGSITGQKRILSASRGSTPVKDLRVSERSHQSGGQEEGESKPYLDFNKELGDLGDRVLNQDATPTDRKMKKLILRSRSIEEREAEKKEVATAPVIKQNPYSKPQDTNRISSQESEKANSNNRLPSQVTFRPTGLGSSNILTKGSIKEIADDGKAWNMKQVPGSLFEDAEQSFDFDTPVPKKVVPLQPREKIAARLPHSRSISSLQTSKPRALMWTLNGPDTNVNISDMRKTLKVTTVSRPLGKQERRPILKNNFNKVERSIF